MIDFSFFFIFIQSIILIVFIPGLFGKVYFTFSLIFFGAIPYLEFINEIFYWGFPRILEDTYLTTNLYIFIANLIFLIFYFLPLIPRPSIDLKVGFKKCKSIKIVSFNRLAFISSTACCFFLYLNQFEVINIFFRSGVETNFNFDQIDTLLIGNLRLIPFISFIIYYSKIGKLTIKGSYLFLLVLVATFPTSIPRFQAAAIYLTLITCFFPSIVSGVKIPSLIIFSIILFFPALDQFRKYDPQVSISSFDHQFIFAGHFDSYQSLANVIQYDVVTYGYQLLGPLLFFIPRSLWLDKPVGSGHFMAKMFDLSFTNISSNFYAEGFINFGFFGIILFAALLGYIFGHASRLLQNPRLPMLSKIFLRYAAFYSFYILRGDLMSSIAYLVGFSVTLSLIFFFARTRVHGYF